MRFKEIRKITGLSQAKFCQKYNIPLRTLEKWEREVIHPSEYLIDLLEFKVRYDYNQLEEE